MKKITKIILWFLLLSILWIFYKDPYIVWWHKPYFYWCNSFFPTDGIEEWKQINDTLLNNIKKYAIWIDFDLQSCENKIWVIIYYDNLNNRNKILKIIWSHFLIKQIPFKMYNL
jgi:hypothetical protein